VADYVYLAHDLLTNEPVAELPLGGVEWSVALNDDGALSANIAAGSARGRRDLRALLHARTAIYPIRDGQFVGNGYILWDDRPVMTQLEIPDGACLGLLSYFNHRRIRDTVTYLQTDQLAIAEDLIRRAQQVPSGDIGIDLLGYTSGVLRDRTYLSSEIKNVREALLQLAAVESGFDVIVDVIAGPSGRPTKRLRLGYPYLGRSQPATGLVFEYPGNVISYDWQRVGSQLATTVWAIGGSPTDDPADALRSRADNPVLLAAGWPVLEADVSLTDITQQATLNAHALGEAAVRAGIVVVPTITVLADDPPLLSYGVGDQVRVRITDDVFGGDPDVPAVDQLARITKISVTVPDNGDMETVSVELSAVVVKL
jgi:hypothetical protein